MPAGYRGVDLFFIISGSVILMTPDRTHAARDFVVSRVTMMPELLRARPVDGVYWTLEVELFFHAAMLVLFAAR